MGIEQSKRAAKVVVRGFDGHDANIDGYHAAGKGFRDGFVKVDRGRTVQGDRDGDGKVSMAERLDADGDGKISMAEYSNFNSSKINETSEHYAAFSVGVNEATRASWASLREGRGNRYSGRYVPLVAERVRQGADKMVHDASKGGWHQVTDTWSGPHGHGASTNRNIRSGSHGTSSYGQAAAQLAGGATPRGVLEQMRRGGR